MDKIKKLIVDSVVEEKGLMSKAIRFVIENQMKDRVTWGKNTEVFTTREDSDEARWRGEFFGKQMRGAALVYTLTKDEELYDILTETVLSLLDRQDEYGRFSTYTVETEFNGWDMWCRKYVLVGMMYYHEICKDEALKERIINACCRHLDYVVAKIGDGEGQKSITATSEWWGCVNSCRELLPSFQPWAFPA